MNATMENILTRRSVRSFEEKEIPREELEQIAKAAIYAPSGQNKQTWKITVVTDRNKIQALAKAVGEKLGRTGYDMYSPQVLVIPSNARENHHSQDDNACAMENIMLAAHSLGIGSVWINQVRDVCDTPEVRSILKEWEIPDSHVIFGIAALGYAKGPVNQNPEKTGAIHFVD